MCQTLKLNLCHAELAAASPAKDTLVLTQTEVTSQETIVDAKVSRAIKRHAGRLETFWGPTLYHLDDLPLRKDLSDLATVFTPFKQQVSPAESTISRHTVISIASMHF